MNVHVHKCQYVVHSVPSDVTKELLLIEKPCWGVGGIFYKLHLRVVRYSSRPSLLLLPSIDAALNNCMIDFICNLFS